MPFFNSVIKKATSKPQTKQAILAKATADATSAVNSVIKSQKELADSSVARSADIKRRKSLSENQLIISDLSDAMNRVPPSLDIESLHKVERIAAYLGNAHQTSETVEASLGKNNSFTEGLVRSSITSIISSNPWSNILKPTINASAHNDVRSDETFRNKYLAARNNIIEVANKVNSFVARAKNSGFAPPSNPFVRIAEMNATRVQGQNLDVPAKEADDIVQNIAVYLDFLKAEQAGTINLSRDRSSSAQLSSVNLSFEGFGGSGNPSSDLLRFLPDMDALKEQRAKEALSVLDFRKRVPKVIFTSNYTLDNELKASIIGWRKISDASGYVIRRRNLFTGEEISYVHSNSELDEIYKGVYEYVQTWVMSFYSSIDPSTIFVCLDGNIQRHAHYSYTVQAYQLFNAAPGTIFSVPTGPLSISLKKRKEIDNQLQILDPGKGDTISPWPILAQQTLGNADYDWILAGVNTRASISRGDPRSETRNYSYIAAQFDFLYKQMDTGKFLIPQDVNQIIKNVQQAINKFGVTQVIQEILQETGILYYFEGKDAKEDTHFSRVGLVTPDTSNIIAMIAASIDPENATLDLMTIASNLPKLLESRQVKGVKTTLSPGADPLSTALTQEIEIPTPNAEGGTGAEDEIQFLQQLGKVDNNHLDLTTFEGISRLIKTIRIISDFGANRGAPIGRTTSVTETINAATGGLKRVGTKIIGGIKLF